MNTLSLLPLQISSSTGSTSDYFLCEEKVPLCKGRCAQLRPLAPEEEVVRLVNSWPPEEGYLGRLCLKTREEVGCLNNPYH